MWWDPKIEVVSSLVQEMYETAIAENIDLLYIPNFSAPMANILKEYGFLQRDLFPINRYFQPGPFDSNPFGESETYFCRLQGNYAI